jgi:uncharacterized RDD family membrane protein YckC
MLFGVVAIGVFVGAAVLLTTSKDPESFGIFIFAAIFAVYLALIIYEGLMLAHRGQTLGKMAVKIRVVRPDGAPITKGQAWGRAILRGVLVHVLSLLNYIPALVTKEKTCIHDLVANTRVVNAD